jgi:molybdenum cofactor biosynthesis protein B
MSNVIHGAVITVSDSAASGARADESGPVACRMLRAAGYVVDDPVVVPDSRPFIAARIRVAAALGSFVVTTGGTGLAPRDVTPEATRDVIDREVPGLAEMLRAEGRRGTPTACLSRGVAGLPRGEPPGQPGRGRGRAALPDPGARPRVEDRGGRHPAPLS